MHCVVGTGTSVAMENTKSMFDETCIISYDVTVGAIA